jgi:hypothetical protein
MSTNPENEKLIDYLVVLDKPGRKFHSEEDNRWGGLIEPAPGENPAKTEDGLRVVLFSSWELGYMALETLKSYESRFPEKVTLAGFVTDHPLNPDAKISVRKRVWGYLDKHERVIDETTIIESALSHGTPVYTGEIKIGSFRRLLEQWNPDVIMVCVFGQLIDASIFNFPVYGIYNFHPSDLLQGYGAGTNPYVDLATRKAETTVWTVHHISEGIDSGHIIGHSPPICVLNREGTLPVNPFVVYNKFAQTLSPMVVILANELHRRWVQKETGAIDHLDFKALFPLDLREKMLKPITRDAPDNMFLNPEQLLFI